MLQSPRNSVSYHTFGAIQHYSLRECGKHIRQPFCPEALSCHKTTDQTEDRKTDIQYVFTVIIHAEANYGSSINNSLIKCYEAISESEFFWSFMYN